LGADRSGGAKQGYRFHSFCQESLHNVTKDCDEYLTFSYGQNE
jgi:hypothetical protein